MKITDLTEKDVIHIRNKKEAKGISKLSNRNVKDLFDDYGKYSGYFHIAKAVEDIRECGGYNIIPASKFLKPSLKKRVKELELKLTSISEQLFDITKFNAATETNDIKGLEVHFDEVEKLPEKWCVKANNDNEAELLTEWVKNNKQTDFTYKRDELQSNYFHYPNHGGIHTARGIIKGYTEISFETFKRLVLKQDENPVELEVNKWYKDTRENSKSLFYIQAIVSPVGHPDITINSYGFTMSGGWSDLCLRNKNVLGKYFRLATDEEVKEALIKEAERRGFKEGIKLRPIMFCSDEVETGKYDYQYVPTASEKVGHRLMLNGTGIYQDGKWAEIIQPEAIDFSKAGQLVESDYAIVWATGGCAGECFAGSLIKVKANQRGAENIQRWWRKNDFKLCTEPVTLSN